MSTRIRIGKIHVVYMSSIVETEIMVIPYLQNDGVRRDQLAFLPASHPKLVHQDEKCLANIYAIYPDDAPSSFDEVFVPFVVEAAVSVAFQDLQMKQEREREQSRKLHGIKRRVIYPILLFWAANFAAIVGRGFDL